MERRQSVFGSPGTGRTRHISISSSHECVVVLLTLHSLSRRRRRRSSRHDTNDSGEKLARMYRYAESRSRAWDTRAKAPKLRAEIALDSPNMVVSGEVKRQEQQEHLLLRILLLNHRRARIEVDSFDWNCMGQCPLAPRGACCVVLRTEPYVTDE